MFKINFMFHAIHGDLEKEDRDDIVKLFDCF